MVTEIKTRNLEGLPEIKLIWTADGFFLDGTSDALNKAAALMGKDKKERVFVEMAVEIIDGDQDIARAAIREQADEWIKEARIVRKMEKV